MKNLFVVNNDLVDLGSLSGQKPKYWFVSASKRHTGQSVGSVGYKSGNELSGLMGWIPTFPKNFAQLICQAWSIIALFWRPSKSIFVIFAFRPSAPKDLDFFFQCLYWMSPQDEIWFRISIIIIRVIKFQSFFREGPINIGGSELFKNGCISLFLRNQQRYKLQWSICTIF